MQTVDVLAQIRDILEIANPVKALLTINDFWNALSTGARRIGSSRFPPQFRRKPQ